VNRLREVINIALAILGILAVGFLMVLLWANRLDPVITQIVRDNFTVIIGLPFAFIAAFIVVALFRQGTGPVEFGGFGLNFKGSAGEVILWIFCFMAITGAIHILWRN
jgi:hypothetical protein